MDDFEMLLKQHEKPIKAAALSVIHRFSMRGKGLDEEAVFSESHIQFWLCYIRQGVSADSPAGRVFLRVRRGIIKAFRLWMPWCKSTREGEKRHITAAYTLGEDLGRTYQPESYSQQLPDDTVALLLKLFGWRGEVLAAYVNGESSRSLIERYSLADKQGMTNLLRTVRRQTDCEVASLLKENL